MADIFISYGRGDREKIERLAAALEAKGWSVWWDRQIVGGADYAEEIERELDAAKTVIAAWSRDAVKSPWVKDEAIIARDQGKLIPISIDGTPSPIGFKQYQLIEMAGWDSDVDAPDFQDLLRTIKARLTGEEPDAPMALSDSAPPRLLRSPLLLTMSALAIAAVVLFVGYTGFNLMQKSRGDSEIAAPARIVSEKSIAVLSFVDMSAAGNQEYFADGIAEEILNVLAKAPELKVVGRTSSFQFKGRNEDLRKVGDLLGVATILEGSIRKSGDRIRVTAQLVRASDGFHLWSESYDRDLADIFRVQEEIADAIAVALQTPLGIEFGTQSKNRTDNLEAYELYLQGLALYAKRGDRVADAVKKFEQSIILDPQFAAAWAALSVTYSVMPGWTDVYEGRAIRAGVFKRYAERAALRAIELNPNIASSQHAMSVGLRSRWQWMQAEDAILNALALEPNSAVILEDYMEFLSSVGRSEDAARIALKLIEIEPLNAFYYAPVAYTQWDLGNYDQAIAAFNRIIEIDPVFSNVFLIEHVALLAETQSADEAAAFLDSCGLCDPDKRDFARRLLNQTNSSETAIADLERLVQKGEGFYFIFKIGGEQAVLDALEHAAVELGSVVAANNYYLREVGSVRSQPRFKQLVRDLGLDAYWRERGWPAFCHPLGDNDFTCD